MKNKKTSAITLVIVLMGCIFMLTGCSKEKKSYQEAVELACEEKVDEAIKLFSELPSDYCPKSADLTSAQWIDELETEYNSGFAGEWEGNGTSSNGATGKIELEIDYFVIETSGVHFYYRMYTWSPGGVMVSSHGDLDIISSNKAKFINSDSSNAQYYELSMNSSGKIVLSFKGEIVAVLSREN